MDLKTGYEYCITIVKDNNKQLLVCFFVFYKKLFFGICFIFWISNVFIHLRYGEQPKACVTHPMTPIQDKLYGIRVSGVGVSGV